MEGVALSLALRPDYFATRYADALILLRLSNCPSRARCLKAPTRNGVSANYVLLTIPSGS